MLKAFAELQALRAATDSRIDTPSFLAAIVVEGAAKVDDERLGAWDFFYADPPGDHAPLTLAAGTTLLTDTLR